MKGLSLQFDGSHRFWPRVVVLFLLIGMTQLEKSNRECRE
jgi:hypothetical protein